MAKQQIHLTVNLEALRGELQRSLQRAIYLVSAGLQAKDQIDPDSLRLPINGIEMTFDAGLVWTADEVQKHYSEWVLSNGFRDVIEGVSSFLESAHQVLSFWELLEKQNEYTDITGSDWNEIVTSGGKRFHRLGLPDKFEHLEKKHGVEIAPKLCEQVVSINIARNCLVHREGIVNERDLNADNELKVQWTKLRMVVQNEDGEKTLVIGETIEKDSILAIQNQLEEKTFALGSQISFNVEEFANIAWGLFLFGSDIVQKLSGLGLEKGFLSEPKPS